MTNDITTDRSAERIPLIRAERRLRELLERSELQLIELESSLTGMLRDHDTLQEDRDSARQVVDAIRADVRQTKRALDRVADGTYGRCASCGMGIAAERVAAIPTVERCGRCA